MGRASCRGCIYYRRFATGGLKACHYLLDTNQKRGCPASNCDKKTKPPGSRNKKPNITKAQKINTPLRKAMKENKIFGYQVAEIIGLTETTFSRKVSRKVIKGYCYHFSDKERMLLSDMFNISTNEIE